MSSNTPVKAIVGVSTLVLLGVLSVGTFTVVPEGHVGIKKMFGRADSQLDPGLNFKFPLIQTVETVEVRQRRNVEELTGATSEQLPIKATVSINWTANKESALDLYVKYGGIPQFEERILDPKLRSVSKAAIAKFSAEDLIKNRNLAVNEIQLMMVEALADFPIVIDSPQIENIDLPPRYLEAVEAKMTAYEAAKRAEFELTKQKTEAHKAVNTAEAERDAEKARADGLAYKRLKEAEAEAKAIEGIGKAEAEAIRQMAEAIQNNPHVADYIRAKTWDGKLPTTMMGADGNMMWQMK